LLQITLSCLFHYFFKQFATLNFIAFYFLYIFLLSLPSQKEDDHHHDWSLSVNQQWQNAVGQRMSIIISFKYYISLFLKIPHITQKGLFVRLDTISTFWQGTMHLWGTLCLVKNEVLRSLGCILAKLDTSSVRFWPGNRKTIRYLLLSCWDCTQTWLKFGLYMCLNQAWATSGPRATSDPPSTLMWPASYIRTFLNS